MNNRLKKQLFAVAGVIILLTVITVINRGGLVTSEQTITQGEVVSSLIKNAITYKKDAIIFSNGRQLVSYNYATGDAKALSTDAFVDGLSNIDSLSVSSDGNYIAFRDELADAGGTLDTTLRNEGLDPTQTYWWVYSIQDGTFHNFPAGVDKVHIKNNVVYALDNTTNSSSITTYNLAGLQQTKSIQVKQTDDFYVTKTGFLLIGSGDDFSSIYETSDGVVNTKIFSNTHILNISDDQKSIIATTQTKDSKTSLLVYDVVTKSQKIIDSNVDTQTISWDTSNDIIYRSVGSKKNTITTYNISTGKTQANVINVPDFDTQELNPIKMFALDAILTTGSDGSYRLIGGQYAEFAVPAADYKKTLSFDNSFLELNYFPSEPAFIVTINRSNTERERAAIYKQLVKDSINPLLVDVRMSLYSTPVVLD